MSLVNLYVQALNDLKGTNRQPVGFCIDNDEFRKRTEQFERESFLYESSQFVTDEFEDVQGDGGDNQANYSELTVISIYEYAINATIANMVVDFSSSADVNIFNDAYTLNQPITSNQPFNITI